MQLSGRTIVFYDTGYSPQISLILEDSTINRNQLNSYLHSIAEELL